MGILKPIASIAPVASNAPVAILPNNVYGKTNLTMSNVFSAMVTIQPTARAALFIKTYRREPFHHFEEDKTANTPMTSRNHIPPLPPPMLPLTNLHPHHPRLTTHNTQGTDSSRNHH